jgi:hypothetical protein
LGCEIDPELDGRFLPIFEAIAEWLVEYEEDPGGGEPVEDIESVITFKPVRSDAG